MVQLVPGGERSSTITSIPSLLDSGSNTGTPVIEQTEEMYKAVIHLRLTI